ncbi:hypothetical protein [Stenotrophomonas hibiscicola]|nr:hypothetical protein [[Pseudomonas] hibiscicola]
MVHTVRSAAREYPAVDLYLSKRERAGWDAYFAEVDAACAQLVAELGRIPEIS